VRARAAITSSAAALVVVAALAGSAVAAPEPDAQADAAALYAEGRRYEDTLADPVHALALYDRVLREHPDASVAVAAEQHAARLRTALAGGHAAEANDFARLVADADQLSPDEVMKRGDVLAAAAWPGAPEAELWLAEWLRRAGRFAAADARYARLLATWPTAPEAKRALSGRTGAAIDARAWDHARELLAALPAATPEDVVVRDDLRAALARGLTRARLATAAWILCVLAFGLLLASLGEAALRGGARRPTLAPPVEIWFFAPIAAVLAGIAFTAHQAIAPVVVWISLAGIALAWLSGATLDLLRARGRAWKSRAIAHVVICAAGIVAVGYLALTSGGLLDLL
jgi:tetratricopeptide (TPR) repeat protein